MIVYIGIDNGTSGSIGIIAGKDVKYIKMPSYRERNYTKKKQFIRRIDFKKLIEILCEYKNLRIKCCMERPYTSKFSKTALISARAFEATLLALQIFNIKPIIIDSLEWQNLYLPGKLIGEERKSASLLLGKKWFPSINFKRFKDADGILIAKYLQYKMTELHHISEMSRYVMEELR